MKSCRRWFTIVAALTVFGMLAQARQKEPQPLFPGLNEERTLGPGENHAYTITLQEGTAVIGAAIQHGTDLVIDEFGPDGKLIRTVDSANGAEGPEPIDLTAFQSGTYKLLIHTLDTTKTAGAGKYVMKIESILTLEENGQRLAEKNYPPCKVFGERFRPIRRPSKISSPAEKAKDRSSRTSMATART